MSTLSRWVLMGALALAGSAAMAEEPAASAAAGQAATEAQAAAPAAAAAAAPTEPYLTTADKISGGDTAWMLTSTALVLMMCDTRTGACSTAAWCARRTCWPR